jgi:hypothetical protein
MQDSIYQEEKLMAVNVKLYKITLTNRQQKVK